jgi:hypothetical protein
MALLLQQSSSLGIGCSNILARARVQCLAAASHAPHLPLLQHVNGGRKACSPAIKTGHATSLSWRRRRDLRVVAEATSAARVTPAKLSGVSFSDVVWPSAGKFPNFRVFSSLWPYLVSFRAPLLLGDVLLTISSL